MEGSLCEHPSTPLAIRVQYTHELARAPHPTTHTHTTTTNNKHVITVTMRSATTLFIIALVCCVIAAPSPTFAADRQLQAFGRGNFYGWLRCSVPWHSCTDEEVARGVSANCAD